MLSQTVFNRLLLWILNLVVTIWKVLIGLCSWDVGIGCGGGGRGVGWGRNLLLLHYAK